MACDIKVSLLEPGRIGFLSFFIFRSCLSLTLSRSLSLSGGRSGLSWILILHLSSEDGSSPFTSAEVATCHWLLISKNPGKLAAKLVRRTRKIWMQTASAPIVPFKAALRVTLCQAVGPVGRGGLSGILIGLALSVISGGALYCKTGLCTIDTIVERKKKLERAQRFTPHTQTMYPAIHYAMLMKGFRLASCLCELLQLMFYFADFYFCPHSVLRPIDPFFFVCNPQPLSVVLLPLDTKLNVNPSQYSRLSPSLSVFHPEVRTSCQGFAE